MNGEFVICRITHGCARFCIHVPMLDVHEPNHISRKSGYWKALNTRAKKGWSGSGEWFWSLDEVEEVAIGVGEEDEPVSLVAVRFGEEMDSLGLELSMGGVKIVHLNG
jgi:hypothetical protein